MPEANTTPFNQQEFNDADASGADAPPGPAATFTPFWSTGIGGGTW